MRLHLVIRKVRYGSGTSAPVRSGECAGALGSGGTWQCRGGHRLSAWCVLAGGSHEIPLVTHSLLTTAPGVALSEPTQSSLLTMILDDLDDGDLKP